MTSPAGALCFTVDGKYILTGHYDGKIYLWDRSVGC
ncbi:MAG: hypothetical protein AB2L14_13280 [Candidatus Xenobiia bacterium LiM19]